MLNWNRWWMRALTVYVTSAIAFIVAVQIELTAVALHWVDVWLDTPMFLSVQGLLRAAVIYPIVAGPFFMLAELEKQIRRTPLPWPAYVLFTALYTMAMFATYDFGRILDPVLAFAGDSVWRLIAEMCFVALVAAVLTALLIVIGRNAFRVAARRRQNTP